MGQLFKKTDKLSEGRGYVCVNVVSRELRPVVEILRKHIRTQDQGDFFFLTVRFILGWNWLPDP